MEKITLLASKCRIATPHDSVLNSECAFTFHSPYTSHKGIVVDLSTFIGTVDSLAFGTDETGEGLFVRIVKERTSKKDTDDSKNKKQEEDTLTQKVTKLGMGVEGGFASEEDLFETLTSYSILKLSKTNDGSVAVEAELPYNEETKNSFPTNISMSADSIIHHTGLAVQQDLKAWELDEEPKPISKYVEGLEFVDNGVKVSPNPSDWKCQKSGETENLWLNLSDGYIGGGRKNWDGSGGSNGALDHFVETGEKYPLVVKLGTITEDIETADCFSYAKDEDCPVKIPNLSELLSKRGINVAGMQKTVKSTAELEVELNASYAFDAITEAGANLVPVSGPGLQGLQNLGNSCYVNSIVQLLFSGSISELCTRYGTVAHGNVACHPLLKISPKDAPLDLLCQTAKLSCALTSGNFAGPVPESATVTDAKSSSTDPKYRLPPRMFKNVVGKDHVDFRTGQQQDAAQYLQFLLEKIERAELGAGDRLKNMSDESSSIPTISNLFSFKTTSRLVCSEDNRVKYKENAPESILSLRVPMDTTGKTNLSDTSEPEEKRHRSDGGEDKSEEKEIPTVSFKSCLDSWSASHTIEGLRWPHLSNAVFPASEEVSFFNFPRYLIVQIQRYELGPDWTPRKLEVRIDMPETIDLNNLKSSGPQEGENVIIENNAGHNDENAVAATSQPKIDEGAVSQLMDMGFSLNGCKRALIAVGGSNVEAAMNWIFEHNTDPDFNDPIQESDSEEAKGSLAEDKEIDEGVVMSLVNNLGCFTAEQVRAALKECDGAADRAADWLFSHMDDLDGAIAGLQNSEAVSSDAVTSSMPLDDGNGTYGLIGLVSHIGKNTGSGHYVAHLKRGEKWVIFNDEKVALSESPPIPHAYMYLFQRTDSIGSPKSGY